MSRIRFTLLLLFVFLVSCEQQTASSPITNYEQARSEFWRSLYANGGVTLYCREPFSAGYNKGINVEHVFPMSWAKNALKCGTRKQCRKSSALFNLIEADLHNLYPSRTDTNQKRSSFAFAEIKGEKRRFGQQCDFEVDERRRVAEPSEEVRGEVARSMFYMADRYKQYGLTIFRKQGEMLLEWHNADPPSSHERDRNDKIESMQGNRNVFVDQPERLNQLVGQGHFY